jgi:hypothetical protein
LGDVGERNHGPEHRSAIVGDELQVDRIGHVMQAGDDERGVEEPEDGAEQHADRAGDAGVDDRGDAEAEPPADGTEHEVGGDDGQDEGAERHDDHRDDGRG